MRADPAAQEVFKKKLRPLLREAKTAFPKVQVELWAMDEHRVGLKPIPRSVRKVWTFDGRRPIAPVQHRYQWRYVSDHVYLLFLPACTPELQPAEHLWPLSDTAFVNRHFATIDDLEDTQAERCVALQARPDLVGSAALFSWWPLLPEAQSPTSASTLALQRIFS